MTQAEQVEPLEAARSFFLMGKGNLQLCQIAHQRLKLPDVDAGNSAWVAFQNLLGLAFELSMKAFLATRGHSEETLRLQNNRHNLIRLFEMCEEAGIAAECQRLNEPHLFNLLRNLAAALGPQYGHHDYRYLRVASVARVTNPDQLANIFVGIEFLLSFAEAGPGAEAATEL